ncbi:MAG: glycosyltransferase family 4 protein [Candidatus Omnitrophota bacterium]
MKILFWVPYPKEGASNRYRVDQFLPYLTKRGIEYTVHPFWSPEAFRILYVKGHYLKKTFYLVRGVFFRIGDIFLIYRYDLVFVHREAFPIGPAFLETILYLLRKPFVFDFDDAVFLPVSSRSNYFIQRFKNNAKIPGIIGMSRAVLAGNDYLAGFARKYNPNVYVIPTVIDTDKCVVKKKGSVSSIVVGWTGSDTTLDFLKPMEPVFRVLSNQFDGLRFKIIGGDPDFNALPNVISIPWSLSDELNQISSFDIGIMPIPDDPWTRGKCGFKAILYMSMEIPCVCSAVGVNKSIIKDGVNGFLASTEKEWIDKLSLLIEDAKLREKIGQAGRKTVEEGYSLKAYSGKFVDILKSVYNQDKKNE